MATVETSRDRRARCSSDFDEAVRQNVLQEAANELFGGDRREFDMLGGQVFVLESNVTSSLGQE